MKRILYENNAVDLGGGGVATAGNEGDAAGDTGGKPATDRQSTRRNSSHQIIS